MLDGEHKLVRDAIRGESSAFGLLYNHYHPKIYRFVFIKVSRREEAEDLTHQVFLHAWEHMGSYEERGYPFSSWLYQIARNAVVDHYRTRKKELSLDEMDPDDFGETVGIELGIHEKFELARVRLAIRELKPTEQDVIIMRFVEDLTPREIAAAVGKSEGAVKLIQHRALKQLKALLKNR